MTVLLPLLSCCLRCSVGTTAGGRGAWGPRVCLLCWLHFLAGHFYQGWLDILVYLSHIIGAVVALHDDEYALPPALHCPPCDLFVAARGGGGVVHFATAATQDGTTRAVRSQSSTMRKEEFAHVVFYSLGIVPRRVDENTRTREKKSINKIHLCPEI